MNVIIVLKEACFRDAVSVSTALLILILIPRPGPKTDLSHGHRLICGFSDMEIISELYYQASNSQITEGESGLVEINITILPFVLYIYCFMSQQCVASRNWSPVAYDTAPRTTMT